MALPCAATARPSRWTANRRQDPPSRQLVAFGTGGRRKVYTVDRVRRRPAQAHGLPGPALEVGLANDDPHSPCPLGSMNLAFQRDSLALVTRPLALPDSRMGVMAAVVPTTGRDARLDAV